MSDETQPTKTAVELDRGALALADLAYIETPGPPADRTKAAIEAYLWAVAVADETGRYPSINQLRAHLAPTVQPTADTRPCCNVTGYGSAISGWHQPDCPSIRRR